MAPIPHMTSPRGTYVYHAPSVIIKELKKRNFTLVEKIDAQNETIRKLEEEKVKSAKKISTLKQYIQRIMHYLLTDAPKIRHAPLCLLQKIKVFDSAQKKE